MNIILTYCIWDEYIKFKNWTAAMGIDYQTTYASPQSRSITMAQEDINLCRLSNIIDKSKWHEGTYYIIRRNFI